jgi:multicomponent Na+:H+ antiporter subunit G
MTIALHAVQGIASGILIVLGVSLLLAGVIGVLRFPDLYTRLHPALASFVGAALALLGLAVGAADAGLFVRLMLLSALFSAVSPLLAQIVGNAAHAGGLAPLAGRQPRHKRFEESGRP